METGRHGPVVWEEEDEFGNKYYRPTCQECNEPWPCRIAKLVALCEEVIDDLRQVVETEFGIGAAEQDVAKWRERLAALNGGTR
jgi:hypothetical protein